MCISSPPSADVFAAGSGHEASLSSDAVGIVGARASSGSPREVAAIAVGADTQGVVARAGLTREVAPAESFECQVKTGHLQDLSASCATAVARPHEGCVVSERPVDPASVVPALQSSSPADNVAQSAPRPRPYLIAIPSVRHLL